MKKLKQFLIVGFILCFVSAFAQNDSLTKATTPPMLGDYNLQLNSDALTFKALGVNGPAKIEINDETTVLNFEAGRAPLTVNTDAKGKLLLIKNQKGYELYHYSRTADLPRLKYIPLWLSVLPPLIAILLALIFKEVIVSLFVGVWVGAFIAGGLRIESFYYILRSFFDVIDTYVLGALTDGGHVSIIIFSILIGGMVAIISKNGGMQGIVLYLSKFAKTPKSAQFITWLLGVAIFFDDYANTLIVGNTMRSVTDQFKISREKLAYIVDSTAAPVAAIAFITTWIGAELGYIDDGISQLNDFGRDVTPYSIFISSLKYSFYPILTLCFILIIIFFQKDYGPMHKAESRARTTGQVVPKTTSNSEIEEVEDLSPISGIPIRWYNAFVPVITVIIVTIIGLVDTGLSGIYSELLAQGVVMDTESWGTIWRNIPQVLPEGDGGFFIKLGKMIGAADSYVALQWASISGVVMAILMTVSQRLMKLSDTASVLLTGFKTMMPAILILTLAWSLAATTEALHTANFLSSTLEGKLNAYLLPALIFVLSAFISFSTGSSWSTMAILYPIAIPTTWVICQAQGLSEDLSFEILLNVISIVLAASVMGDHCSPISDTTILSSLASDCNHIDHVRTQLPYSLTVGTVSIILGSLSTLLGGGFLVCLLLFGAGIAIMIAVVMKFGKNIPD